MSHAVPSPEEISATVAATLAAHEGAEGPLLPILHDLQGAWGHIPAAALPLVAEGLNLTRAEVHGVMSFYHDFRTVPAGRHVVRLCRAEACQSMGGAGLAEIAKDRLGVDWHGTSAEGVTLEPVFCLGLCACAPAAMVDGELRGRLDRDAIEAICAEVRS